MPQPKHQKQNPWGLSTWAYRLAWCLFLVPGFLLWATDKYWRKSHTDSDKNSNATVSMASAPVANPSSTHQNVNSALVRQNSTVAPIPPSLNTAVMNPDHAIASSNSWWPRDLYANYKKNSKLHELWNDMVKRLRETQELLPVHFDDQGKSTHTFDAHTGSQQGPFYPSKWRLRTHIRMLAKQDQYLQIPELEFSMFGIENFTSRMINNNFEQNFYMLVKHAIENDLLLTIECRFKSSPTPAVGSTDPIIDKIFGTTFLKVENPQIARITN